MLKIKLQFFGDDPTPEEPEKEKDDGGVSAAIAELKKRAEAAEKKAADLEKKNAEQEEAIKALMGDGENNHDAKTGRFWTGLRYMKRRDN